MGPYQGKLHRECDIWGEYSTVLKVSSSSRWEAWAGGRTVCRQRVLPEQSVGGEEPWTSEYLKTT